MKLSARLFLCAALFVVWAAASRVVFYGFGPVDDVYSTFVGMPALAAAVLFPLFALAFVLSGAPESAPAADGEKPRSVWS